MGRSEQVGCSVVESLLVSFLERRAAAKGESDAHHNTGQISKSEEVLQFGQDVSSWLLGVQKLTFEDLLVDWRVEHWHQQRQQSCMSA